VRLRVAPSKLNRIIMARYKDQLVDIALKMASSPELKAALDRLAKAKARLRRKRAEKDN
jgi:hypothetical protein